MNDTMFMSMVKSNQNLLDPAESLVERHSLLFDVLSQNLPRNIFSHQDKAISIFSLKKFLYAQNIGVLGNLINRLEGIAD